MTFTVEELQHLYVMACNRDGRVQIAYNPHSGKWATNHGPIAPPHIGDA